MAHTLLACPSRSGPHLPTFPTMESDNSVRISLLQRNPSLSLGTCISKHYALNNQILSAFESNYQGRRWLAAYHFGLKFVETSLLVIPRHGYFYSETFGHVRQQSTIDSLRVCHQLQDIATKQPNELAMESNKLELLQYLATEQYGHLSNYEETRKRVAKELKKLDEQGQKLNTGESSTSTFAATLLACGDTFTSVFCPTSVNAISSDEYAAKFNDDPSGVLDSRKGQLLHRQASAERRQAEESSKTIGSQQIRQSFDHSNGVHSTKSCHDHDRRDHTESQRTYEPYVHRADSQISLGAPLQDFTPYVPREHSDFDLQRALFLSGLQVNLEENGEEKDAPTQELNQQPALPRAKKRDFSSIATSSIASLYADEFSKLLEVGKISTHSLSTFQGRIPESTNGCAIIAPLICMRHFASGDSIPDTGLSDEDIATVIDDETPIILPVVRKSLGLVKDAFLIPADAHDSLMEQKRLHQDQFSTVCGGNILDESHLQSFLDEIGKVGRKKLAANLFFKEHVISILQLRRGTSTVWFDVIDSLPHEQTMQPADQFSSRGLISCMGVERLSAVRFRCTDKESLRVFLVWYAYSVFTDENKAYIDTYEWDERLSDFDPRVFQAFIWRAL